MKSIIDFSLVFCGVFFAGHTPVVVRQKHSPEVRSLCSCWQQRRCGKSGHPYKCDSKRCKIISPERKYWTYHGGPLGWSGGASGRAEHLKLRYKPRYQVVDGVRVDSLDFVGIRSDLVPSRALEEVHTRSWDERDMKSFEYVAHEMAHERQQTCPTDGSVQALTVHLAEREAITEQAGALEELYQETYKKQIKTRASLVRCSKWPMLFLGAALRKVPRLALYSARLIPLFLFVLWVTFYMTSTIKAGGALGWLSTAFVGMAVTVVCWDIYRMIQQTISIQQERKRSSTLT